MKWLPIRSVDSLPSLNWSCSSYPSTLSYSLSLLSDGTNHWGMQPGLLLLFLFWCFVKTITKHHYQMCTALSVHCIWRGAIDACGASVAGEPFLFELSIQKRNFCAETSCKWIGNACGKPMARKTKPDVHPCKKNVTMKNTTVGCFAIQKSDSHYLHCIFGHTQYKWLKYFSELAYCHNLSLPEKSIVQTSRDSAEMQQDSDRHFGLLDKMWAKWFRLLLRNSNDLPNPFQYPLSALHVLWSQIQPKLCPKISHLFEVPSPTLVQILISALQTSSFPIFKHNSGAPVRVSFSLLVALQPRIHSCVFPPYIRTHF